MADSANSRTLLTAELGQPGSCIESHLPGTASSSAATCRNWRRCPTSQFTLEAAVHGRSICKGTSIHAAFQALSATAEQLQMGDSGGCENTSCNNIFPSICGVQLPFLGSRALAGPADRPSRRQTRTPQDLPAAAGAARRCPRAHAAALCGRQGEALSGTERATGALGRSAEPRRLPPRKAGLLNPPPVAVKRNSPKQTDAPACLCRVSRLRTSRL
jgi:hypothetical protein